MLSILKEHVVFNSRSAWHNVKVVLLLDSVYHWVAEVGRSVQNQIYKGEYFRKGGWFDSSSKWLEVQTEVDVSWIF